MSTDRETTRVVRSWLEEGITALPDRVLDAVLDQIPATPQRRSWWPARRSARMNTYAKLAIAMAAVVVVAVVGSRFLPGNGIGGPGTQPPSATPGSTPALLPPDDTAVLPAGDYAVGDPFPVRITVALPAEWHGHLAGPYYADLWTGAGTTGGLFFLRPSQVVIDPCDQTKGFADIGGESVDDLTTALRHVPGITVTNVASTTVAGYRGTALAVTAPASISGCSVSSYGYTIWQNPLGGQSPTYAAGESIHFWILDVAGTRLVIGNQDANYSATVRAQAQAIFASIRIAPAS